MHDTGIGADAVHGLRVLDVGALLEDLAVGGIGGHAWPVGKGYPISGRSISVHIMAYRWSSIGCGQLVSQGKDCWAAIPDVVRSLAEALGGGGHLLTPREKEPHYADTDKASPAQHRTSKREGSNARQGRATQASKAASNGSSKWDVIEVVTEAMGEPATTSLSLSL